jgi:hypothetical protein
MGVSRPINKFSGIVDGLTRAVKGLQVYLASQPLLSPFEVDPASLSSPQLFIYDCITRGRLSIVIRHIV